MGYNKQFIDNQALSASFNSSALQVGQTGLIASVYSIQAAFTGATCSFSAKIQVSNDSVSPENWDDLENSSQTFTEAGTFTWNVSEVGYMWIRLVITDNSSGTNDGNLSATINVNP